MTKKHYVRIAEIIRNRKEAIEHAIKTRKADTWLENFRGMRQENELLACQLAAYFQGENPSFQYGRFLTACGIESSSNSTEVKK